MKAIAEAFENQNFEDIRAQIIDEIEKAPELADLRDNLMIDITPEGLRIQIIDNEGRSMFPIGSADMYDFMRALVEKVTQVVIPQPNDISVRGHTDGTQYRPGAAYNNWNLSSDRAIASQRAMLDFGLPYERVENVVGKADREHLLPDEPLSPRNRRISIILLREKLDNAEQIRQKAAEAVKATQEKAARQRALEEDRENAPEFDQVIEGSTTFTIQNDVDQQPIEGTDSNEVNIGREIEQIRENTQRRNQTPQRIITLPAPEVDEDVSSEPQVLEFP